MNPILEIFSQGEEIVTGQITDSNASWLSQQAVQLGFTVARHSAVGDKLDALAQLLQEIAERADCCLCTGGLGPTSDDLTAEAVALAFNRPLQFDEIAFANMKRFFATRHKPMPASNRKQAMLPQNSERIDNDWGTAPGFAVQQQRCWFVFLPGVPSEMKSMFEEKIRPAIAGRFFLKPEQLITLRTFGIGESDIQERIKTVAISDPIRLGFRADSDEVQIKLSFPAGYQEAAAALLSEIRAKLGRHVFAVDGWRETGGSLIAVVDRLMKEGSHTLAVIESASQGLLAAKCIGLPWLLETRYQSSLEMLGETFAVPIHRQDLIATAKQLAAAQQKNSAADITLVQLCGSDNREFHDQNRAITVHTVLLHRGHFLEAAQHTLAGSMQRKQNQAALLALDLLRRYLQP